MLDGEDYDCTTKSEGQDSGPVIRWDMPKRMVKTVRVDFRSGDPAQIGDLKIYWYKIDTAEGQFMYDVEQTYKPTLPVIGSFDEKPLWIKARAAQSLYCPKWTLKN